MNNRITNALWGIIFVLLGVLFAGNAMDLWYFDIFFNGWWTLFIIVPSIIGLFQRDSRTGSLIGLVIGVMLLLSAQDIISWDVMGKMIIPLIFIIIGLKIIFRTSSKKNFETKHINKDGLVDYSAIFASNNVIFPCEEFNGANIMAIFGGVDLSLKNAIITKDISINTTSVFGGVEIILPPNVNVKVSSVPIFGGVSNKANPIYDVGTPTIYINSTCIFGGTEIK